MMQIGFDFGTYGMDWRKGKDLEGSCKQFGFTKKPQAPHGIRIVVTRQVVLDAVNFTWEAQLGAMSRHA